MLPVSTWLISVLLHVLKFEESRDTYSATIAAYFIIACTSLFKFCFFSILLGRSAYSYVKLNILYLCHRLRSRMCKQLKKLFFQMI